MSGNYVRRLPEPASLSCRAGKLPPAYRSLFVLRLTVAGANASWGSLLGAALRWFAQHQIAKPSQREPPTPNCHNLHPQRLAPCSFRIVVVGQKVLAVQHQRGIGRDASIRLLRLAHLLQEACFELFPVFAAHRCLPLEPAQLRDVYHRQRPGARPRWFLPAASPAESRRVVLTAQPPDPLTKALVEFGGSP
jgi:hypothetical protein